MVSTDKCENLVGQWRHWTSNNRVFCYQKKIRMILIALKKRFQEPRFFLVRQRQHSMKRVSLPLLCLQFFLMSSVFEINAGIK